MTKRDSFSLKWNDSPDQLREGKTRLGGTFFMDFDKYIDIGELEEYKYNKYGNEVLYIGIDGVRDRFHGRLVGVWSRRVVRSCFGR